MINGARLGIVSSFVAHIINLQLKALRAPLFDGNLFRRLVVYGSVLNRADGRCGQDAMALPTTWWSR